MTFLRRKFESLPDYARIATVAIVVESNTLQDQVDLRGLAQHLGFSA
jgi:hypothetical protein